MAYDGALILLERMNKLLLMTTIAHIMKVSYIRVSFKNKLVFDLLVPFKLISCNRHVISFDWVLSSISRIISKHILLIASSSSMYAAYM
jgi:hypothetical protein